MWANVFRVIGIDGLGGREVMRPNGEAVSDLDRHDPVAAAIRDVGELRGGIVDEHRGVAADRQLCEPGTGGVGEQERATVGVDRERAIVDRRDPRSGEVGGCRFRGRDAGDPR
jgi:hypothetical protein